MCSEKNLSYFIFLFCLICVCTHLNILKKKKSYNTNKLCLDYNLSKLSISKKTVPKRNFCVDWCA